MADAQMVAMVTKTTATVGQKLLIRDPDTLDWSDFDPQPPWSPTNITNPGLACWGDSVAGHLFVCRSHNEGVYYYNGNSWELQALPLPGSASTGLFVANLHGNSISDVWLASGYQTASLYPSLWHYDGDSWTNDDSLRSTVTGTLESIDDIWEAPDGGLWCVCNMASAPYQLWHRSAGGSWTDHTATVYALRLGCQAYAIYGTATDSVWAAGGLDSSSGFYALAHWDGSAWSLTYSNGSSFAYPHSNGVWSPGGSDVVAINAGRMEAYVWDGSTNTVQVVPTTSGGLAHIGDVYGISLTNLATGGQWSPGGGSVWSSDGSAWTRVSALDGIYQWGQFGALMLPQEILNPSFELAATARGQANSWTHSINSSITGGLGRFNR